MNIVDMLLKLLGGGAGKQLAKMLGISEDKAEMALKAALPALLAALTGVASSKDGAQKLASAVEGADDGILENLGSLLGGQSTGVADKGRSALSSLLDGGTMGSLTSVLGKFTGMGSGATATLMGSLAPIVLGFLKRETKSTGFDPTSLTNLLVGQKDNIARAMPAGLGTMLGDIPGLGNVASLAHAARSTAGSTVNRAGETARSAATEGANAFKWVAPLLVALALGFIAWNYWLKPQEPRPVADRDEKPSSAAAASTVTAARISEEIARQVTDATKSTTDIFADATKALSNVTDVASAETAAELLPQLTDRLGQLKSLTEAIPEAQRKPILETIAKSRGTLMTLLEGILKLPGVSDILAPHVDKLKAALNAFDA